MLLRCSLLDVLSDMRTFECQVKDMIHVDKKVRTRFQSVRKEVKHECMRLWQPRTGSTCHHR